MSGDISLDFVNTAEWHAGPHPEERLTDYAVAVEWAREHGIVDEQQAARLAAAALASRETGAEALARVIALREAVYRIFSAVAHHRSPATADVELLDAVSREGAAHLRLVVGGDGERNIDSAELPHFELVWHGLADDPAGFLWPVARAATELLTSGQLSQLRECAGDSCGWVFLDLSKNSSRRWCDMADCGNRAKARRYRERKKGAAAPAAAAAGRAGAPPAPPIDGPAAGGEAKTG